MKKREPQPVKPVDREDFQKEFDQLCMKYNLERAAMVVQMNDKEQKYFTMLGCFHVKGGRGEKALSQSFMKLMKQTNGLTVSGLDNASYTVRTVRAQIMAKRQMKAMADSIKDVTEELLSITKPKVMAKIKDIRDRKNALARAQKYEEAAALRQEERDLMIKHGLL